jgi:hypothetical protein
MQGPACELPRRHQPVEKSEIVVDEGPALAPPWVRPGIGYDLVDSAEAGHIAMLGPDRRRVERPDPGNPPEPFADLAV